MLNTIKVSIAGTEKEFGVFTTTAPKAYDYGNTIEVREAFGDDEPRVVIVEVSGIEYQKGRNASGLHTLTEAEEWVFPHIEGWLWDRVYGTSRDAVTPIKAVS